MSSALLAAALCGPAVAAPPSSPPPPATATVMTPGPFTLKTPDGRKVDALDLDGEPYGVFFGFTHCPDICPTTLADASRALQRLGEAEKTFRLYFIAVDPDRDTPKAVAEFLSAFDPRIVGLTGGAKAVAEAVAAFGAVARKAKLSSGGYTMEHTAAIYLVDRNGVIADRAPFSDPPEALAARIAAVAAR